MAGGKESFDGASRRGKQSGSEEGAGARGGFRRVHSDGSMPSRTRILGGKGQGFSGVRSGLVKAKPGSSATADQNVEDRLQSLLQGMDRAKQKQAARNRKRRSVNGEEEQEDGAGVSPRRDPDDEGEESLYIDELDEDLAEMDKLMGVTSMDELKQLCKSRGIMEADVELCSDRQGLMKLMQQQTLKDLPVEDLRLLCKARGVSQDIIVKYAADSQALALLAFEAGLSGEKDQWARSVDRMSHDTAGPGAGIFDSMTSSELQILCKARGVSDANIEECRDRQALVLLAQQQAGSSLSVDELKHILKSRGVSEDAEIWKLLDEDLLTEELKASLVSHGTSQQAINKLTSKDAIDLFVRDWQQKRSENSENHVLSVSLNDGSYLDSTGCAKVLRRERRSKTSIQNTPDSSICFIKPDVLVQHSNDELISVLGKSSKILADNEASGKSGSVLRSHYADIEEMEKTELCDESLTVKVTDVSVAAYTEPGLPGELVGIFPVRSTEIRRPNHLHSSFDAWLSAGIFSDVEDTLPQALPTAKSKNLAWQHQGHHEAVHQEHLFRRTQSEPGQQWSRVSSSAGGMCTDGNFCKHLDSSMTSQAPHVKRPNCKMTQREKICAGQQKASPPHASMGVHLRAHVQTQNAANQVRGLAGRLPQNTCLFVDPSGLKQRSSALQGQIARKEHAFVASRLSMEKTKTAMVDPFRVSRGRVDKTSPNDKHQEKKSSPKDFKASPIYPSAISSPDAPWGAWSKDSAPFDFHVSAGLRDTAVDEARQIQDELLSDSIGAGTTAGLQREIFRPHPAEFTSAVGGTDGSIALPVIDTTTPITR